MYILRDEMLSVCGLKPSDGVLIALSGGADSVALLLESFRWKRENKIAAVAAAHFHHGIRGVEADRDAAFCRDLCNRLAISYYEGRADIPSLAKEKGLSLETAAREERYRFLRKTKEAAGLSCIATAHHRDDQAETLLLHLIRGSGLEGLCGMRPKNDDVIRPLLYVSKADILSFLAERNQPYCMDSTNDSLDATRNRIRHSVLPLLRELNPNVSDSLSRTAAYLSEDAAHLQAEAEKAFADVKNRYALAQLPPAVRKRVTRYYLPYSDFDRNDVETLDSLLTAQTGTIRMLKNGFIAWTDSERLHVDQQEPVDYCVPLFVGEPCKLPNGKTVTLEKVETSFFPCNPVEAYIDASAVRGELSVRTMRAGDRFTPFGMKGSRLLSDYFTDRKVPRFSRNVPLVCDESGIVWAAGYTVDDRVKVCSTTKQLYHITLKEG